MKQVCFNESASIFTVVKLLICIFGNPWSVTRKWSWHIFALMCRELNALSVHSLIENRNPSTTSTHFVISNEKRSSCFLSTSDSFASKCVPTCSAPAICLCYVRRIRRCKRLWLVLLGHKTGHLIMLMAKPQKQSDNDLAESKWMKI